MGVADGAGTHVHTAPIRAKVNWHADNVNLHFYLSNSNLFCREEKRKSFIFLDGTRPFEFAGQMPDPVFHQFYFPVWQKVQHASARFKTLSDDLQLNAKEELFRQLADEGRLAA